MKPLAKWVSGTRSARAQAVEKIGVWALRAGIAAYARHDLVKALRYWRLASRAEALDANLHIGEIYERGEFVHRSPVDAAAWYFRAASHDHAEAQFRLGRLHLLGGGSMSLSGWAPRARLERPEFVETVTAALFPSGEALSPDPERAVDWLTRAAAGGHATAAALLGTVFLGSHGVGQDFEAARRWFSAAAEAGEPTGQFGLGEIHYRGLGVETNLALGAEWYEKAADQGHSGAQLAIATIYSTGLGRTVDLERSGHYMAQAAEGGAIFALHAAGAMHLTGKGLPKNLDRAETYLRRAAKGDYLPAMLALAEL
jgi:hypothetical protein